ncbi:MAG: threonine ammonia-lyase, biosynthetic, partial [Saezia sp.]
QLPLDILKRGVICASAGNHAQGVALAARHLGCTAVIVMPQTTPDVKVEAVKSLGGEIVLFGESYSDAAGHAEELAQQKKLTFIHPFDDPDVIAGQGTVAMEILRQHQGPLDAIFVPIGGGGLAAGTVAYIKAVRPEIKVIGVQMQDSDAMFQSVKKGERVTLTDVGLFSDGTAVKQVGKETFRLVNGLIDDFVIIDTDAVCAAIKDVFQDTRNIVEPSGAMSVAAVKQYIQNHNIKNGKFVAILSGANMNFDRLRFVADRALYGEHREALFAVTIPEKPGAFREFCNIIGSRNVTEFNYRISDTAEAHIFVSVATSGNPDENTEIASRLMQKGFPTLDISKDDMAKEHIRYMVGGRTPLATGERLLRIKVPERPGVLMKFLTSLNPQWNISLFHYRHSGADFGYILVGIQHPEDSRQAFESFLRSLTYSWVEETENKLYQLFLR